MFFDNVASSSVSILYEFENSGFSYKVLVLVHVTKLIDPRHSCEPNTGKNTQKMVMLKNVHKTVNKSSTKETSTLSILPQKLRAIQMPTACRN